MAKKVQLAPSILSADFGFLARAIELVGDAGARIIHFDVMDGHFVPNLTIGLPVLESIRKSTDLTIDVHLMITNPDEMAVRYVDAGADIVTVQYEACRHLNRTLNEIRNRGGRAGVALNPHSPVSLLEEVALVADLVLIMSVNPGFGGQHFIPSSLEKIRKTRRLLDSLKSEALIEVDGGINDENIGAVAEAGADILVAGSAVFGAEDPGERFRYLRSAAEKATG